MKGQNRGDRVNSVYAALLMRAKSEADKKNLTMRDLAALSAIPETRLRAIFEDSARQVTLRELVALSTALEIPVTALISPLR
ncbi:hypothetical protein SZ64_00570 [Erythrobacter sp. SG61-1L]|uniref:helix-turn-helix domain-containing protein n=1 Tax=Erythrobacter sp. SG61-1L TaxID=1603897 RepID=UPI0006C90792|nr:helix-turn-helix domain-containing protein [Erythrobacter sp. SG61-1L]KPL69933.1 hypothetical protein SZ64_00570 [Erythrobacter sp. SG61-1L]